MLPENKIYGTIFDIQGHSVHDGPGSRTLIFFKGCPMRCSWCSNPEGQNIYPEPMYLRNKCIYDKLCLNSCPSLAISLEQKHDQISSSGLIFDRNKCSVCSDYKCAKVCCGNALRIAGYKISVDEVFEKIQRDRAYWGNEGGITLTGGEPLMQGEFALDLLRKCYDSYIHTAIETCGYFRSDVVKKVLPFLDWIFFDLKHMNEKRHLELTGVSNKFILENAKLIASDFKGKLVFRAVIVPGYNDDWDSIKNFALFLNSLPLEKKELNILPLHHMGKEKYTMLGRKYYFADEPFGNEESLLEIQKFFKQNKINCYLGSDTPF